MNILEIIFSILIYEIHGHYLQDIEVIELPLWNAESPSQISLSLKVFGQQIDLSLRRNDKIVAPNFQIWKHNQKNEYAERLLKLDNPVSCYYLHQDDVSSAAINLCQQQAVHGFIFLVDMSLEIIPVQEAVPSFFKNYYTIENSDLLTRLHVVKRTRIPLISHEKLFNQYSINPKRLVRTESFSGSHNRQVSGDLTLEMAVFFDEAAYRHFSPYLDGDDEKIRDMLLAYVNGIQALFHHPSLGINIDISLVRLDIMERQPFNLPHFEGDRGTLLDSFCNYANAHNPPYDDHPNHWDMGLYVSGLDFFAVENGKKNSATMGLATVGGLCIPQYSCVIVEFGVTNYFGKPYPSAGFTSVYIAAHEIGHNLGMHHDSTGNFCSRDGYIMSPSRGTQGETIWSKCSRDVALALPETKSCLLDKSNESHDQYLDHTRFEDLPGREWSAKRQCELLLRDKDASFSTLFQACQSLQCHTPHRSGYYFAGPALDGTHCAPGHECQGGECIAAIQTPPIGDYTNLHEGHWSKWKIDACKSGCLQKSTGAQQRHRFCEQQKSNTNGECVGPHYDVTLCRDDKLCKKNRKTTIEFATMRCGQFSRKLSELDGEADGLQTPHEFERPWMACAIFCRRKDIASYYAPLMELNDLGLDPYFPDGTWCYRGDKEDYFCRQHHCLPKSFRFGRLFAYDQSDDDILFGPQNAHPDERGFTAKDIKELGSAPDGLPLLTSWPSDGGSLNQVDEWIDVDYRELTNSI